MENLRVAHPARVPFSAARRKADAMHGKRKRAICTPRPHLAFGGPPNAASGPDALPGIRSRAMGEVSPAVSDFRNYLL